MNSFQKQLYYWTHMLDESTLEKKPSSKTLNEMKTAVDGDTHTAKFWSSSSRLLLRIWTRRRSADALRSRI